MRVVRVGAAGTAMELARLFRGVPMVLSTPSQPRGVVSDIGFAPQLVIATPGAEPRVRGESPAQCEYRAVAILDAWTSLYASGIDADVDTLTGWMRAVSLCAPSIHVNWKAPRTGSKQSCASHRADEPNWRCGCVRQAPATWLHANLGNCDSRWIRRNASDGRPLNVKHWND